MELQFPRLTTLTAVTNIYLLLSLTIIQVYATNKPHQVASASDNADDTVNSDDNIIKVGDIIEIATVEEIAPQIVFSESDHLRKRSVDSDYYYEDEAFFRPSVKFESFKEAAPRPSRDHAIYFRHQERPSRYQSQRSEVLRHEQRFRDERKPQRNVERNGFYERERESSNLPRQKPFRRQSDYERNRPQPQHPPSTYFDYDDFDYGFGLQEPPRRKPQNVLDSFFDFLRPKKRKSSYQEPTDLSEPSLEWLYNDIPDEKDEFFIPNNADYDEGNIDLRDPIYDFKDVIHSIRNNESRVLTLKKFLSAASSFSDKAGTDPVQALTTMPVTILSILGVFYAVSAIAVLGYKYTLFTAGSTNGQAVALIPVAILFAVPLVAAIVYVTARSSIDGKISLQRLARGDRDWMRPDFDSIDFVYDVGVGATALLGLGWVVSIAV